ncbi:hypothetical protein CH354_06235 [Leptospira levettii]|uniref:Uncharacterized protein n=1 Tax=Leptospira limi TaxID=2950023 RepID=A0ABT3LT31_9LEPT|nr:MULTISPECIES: hypothetical protein [Leptospira]MCW7460867.1 hypothetical protein [Leptospira limi]MCW7474454.1 hypothetical protein [Leptospira levettii]PJZ38784.1 hypothetical protein CH354_06235 [Leptospira levettii]PJZ90555.1 hypothetical protein CH368_01275 [Leptospira levettii]PKA02088.1 hypothetical protein CH369_02655 [Leptospira levettii]
MPQKSLPKNEFYVKCPLYAKGLSVCPSSKDRLQSEDLSRLTSHCVQDLYKACDIFSAKKEKEQAA